jgi:hypothetical protein
MFSTLFQRSRLLCQILYLELLQAQMRGKAAASHDIQQAISRLEEARCRLEEALHDLQKIGEMEASAPIKDFAVGMQECVVYAAETTLRSSVFGAEWLLRVPRTSRGSPAT